MWSRNNIYLGNQINGDRQTHMGLYTLFRTEVNNHTLCPATYLRIGHIREYHYRNVPIKKRRP